MPKIETDLYVLAPPKTLWCFAGHGLPSELDALEAQLISMGLQFRARRYVEGESPPCAPWQRGKCGALHNVDWIRAALREQRKGFSMPLPNPPKHTLP